MWAYQNTDELYHHGILGMKWGIRRYQNKNGSLTPAGKKRYGETAQKAKKLMGNSKYNYNKNTYGIKRVDRMVKSMDKKGMTYKEALSKEQKRLAKIRTAKALAITGGLTLGYIDLLTWGDAHRAAISLAKSGKKAVTNTLNKHAKSMILDSNGKVIKRYYTKSLVKNVGAVAGVLKRGGK